MKNIFLFFCLYKKMSNIAEEYEKRVFLIINDTILRTIQKLPSTVEIGVVGGKAINALFDRKYGTESYDWDLNVISKRKGTTNNEARDFVAIRFMKMLNSLLLQHYIKLDIINKKYGVNEFKFVYEINKNPFISYTGEKYNIGHINVKTDKFGVINIVDLIPIRLNAEEQFIKIDGINYLGIQGIIENIKMMIQLPGYKKIDKAKKRLQNIQRAMATNSYSCNWHHIYHTSTNDNKLVRCVKETFLGPEDPYVTNNRTYPKYSFNVHDYSANMNYISKLSDYQIKIIKDYTENKSFVWNNQLLYNVYIEKTDISEEILELQKIILNAPVLKNDLIVFMVSRYFYNSKTNKSNYDYKPGDIIKFEQFVSTSYNNRYSPYAFMDLFSQGVALAITIPKGSRALFIDKVSTFQQEFEVLLPFGTKFSVDTKNENKEITYVDNFGFWYDQMITYKCTLLPSEIEIKKEIISHALPLINPTISDEKIHELLKNKEISDIFSKLFNILLQ